MATPRWIWGRKDRCQSAGGAVMDPRKDPENKDSVSCLDCLEYHIPEPTMFRHRAKNFTDGLLKSSLWHYLGNISLTSEALRR